MTYVDRAGLSVDEQLAKFVETELLAGTQLAAKDFWAGYAAILADLAPENAHLLAKRDALQAQIDTWHAAHAGQPYDADATRNFLTEIGYLVPQGPDFEIGTGKVDPEMSSLAGPQLVVPVMNARFALNAANARWGGRSMMRSTARMRCQVRLRAKVMTPRAARRPSLGPLISSMARCPPCTRLA